MMADDSPGRQGPRFKLSPDAGIGVVTLRVADLERSIVFYRDVLGFHVGPVRNGSEASLGSGRADGSGFGSELLRLVECRGAVPRPRLTTGLYHVAVLFPDRSWLGAALRRLVTAGYPLQGASDHAVSEALYLADPDGNGLELYADRPRSSWIRDGERVHMTTRPLDLESLLQAGTERVEGLRRDGLPPGTTIGHIHLQVSDLARAEQFYHGVLGFAVTNSNYPGALFLAAGGYHHHIGLNTWAGEGAPRPPDNAAGLIEFQVRTGLPGVRERLYDPDGHCVVVTT